jgi:cell division protein FtsZ
MLAARMAVESPLLEDVQIDGATGILINITGGGNMTLVEVNQACSLIQEAAHEDANIIFGSVIDDAMSEDLKITVIATGFAGREVRRIDRADATRLSKGQGGQGLADVRTEPLAGRHGGTAARTPELQRATPAPGGAGRPAPSPARATPPPAQPRAATDRPVRHLSLDDVRKIAGIDEDELDIPTFLRHTE